jgi:hypothetical protein
VAQRPGEGPLEQKAPELPDVRGPRVPVGYRPGFQLKERLQGLALVFLGLLGFALVSAMPPPAGLPGAPQGPGGLAAPPLLAPAACLTPLIVLGSVGLIVVGLRQMISP